MTMSRKKADQADNGDLENGQMPDTVISADGAPASKAVIYGYYAALSILALVVSSPTAANAAAGATNSNPNDLTPERFLHNFTSSEQFWTTVDGASSLAINAVVFFDFSLQLGNTLNGISDKFSKNLVEKLLLSSLLVLSVCSAAAAFGLGEDNFVYLQENLWLIPALSFALSTFVTRASSLDSIATRLRNLKNEDAQLQAKASHALKNIDPRVLPGVTHTFNVIKTQYLKKTNNPTYEGLAIEFFEGFNVAHSQPETFRKITPLQHGARFFGTTVDALIAPASAIPTGLTFAQKGYNGFNDIFKMFNSNWLNTLPTAYQIPFGLGGLASAALYARTYDYRQTLIDLLTHIKEHKKQYSLYAWTAAIFLLNIPASKSGQNMGQKIVDNENSWIYSWFPHDEATSESGNPLIDKDAFSAMVYVMLNQIGVFLVNSKSCIEVLITRPPRIPNNDLDFQTFIRRLANPVSTIITSDELRADINKMLESFNTRQNMRRQHRRETEKSPLLQGSAIASAPQSDPEAHPSSQSRPTSKAPSTGYNTTTIVPPSRRSLQ